MGFKLGDFVPQATRDTLPEDRCVTGKRVFRSKAAAWDSVRTIRSATRTTMRPFKCGWCPGWHLGHRRGAR